MHDNERERKSFNEVHISSITKAIMKSLFSFYAIFSLVISDLPYIVIKNFLFRIFIKKGKR